MKRRDLAASCLASFIVEAILLREFSGFRASLVGYLVPERGAPANPEKEEKTKIMSDQKISPAPSSSSGDDGGDAAQNAAAPDKPVTQAVIEQTQKLTGMFVEGAKSQAKTQIETRKNGVADTILSVAEALRASGDRLRSGGVEAPAPYVDNVAGQVASLSTLLRDKNLEQLTAETEKFARRQPALFLAGAFVLGVIAARFLKASEAGSAAAAS